MQNPATHQAPDRGQISPPDAHGAIAVHALFHQPRQHLRRAPAKALIDWNIAVGDFVAHDMAVNEAVNILADGAPALLGEGPEQQG